MLKRELGKLIYSEVAIKNLLVSKFIWVYLSIGIGIFVIMNLFLIINDSAINESPKTVEFEFTVLHDESRPMEGDKMHAVHSFVVSDKENPILEINKGDLVMISFVNTDKMVKHDLVIPELNLQTKILDYGESAKLQFRPSAMGNFVYLCSLHPDQMKGSFVII